MSATAWGSVLTSSLSLTQISCVDQPISAAIGLITCVASDRHALGLACVGDFLVLVFSYTFDVRLRIPRRLIMGSPPVTVLRDYSKMNKVYAAMMVDVHSCYYPKYVCRERR